MTRFLRSLIAAGVFCVAAHAAAVSLTNDFSLASNPNGQWSYQDNAANLSFQIPTNNGNAFYPAASGGMWGVGPNLNADVPFLVKAQVNGSGAGSNDGDFLAGDIVGHSPNDATTLFVRWTAPSSGNIANLQMLVWYAHSGVIRSDDYILLDNATTLTSGTVNNGVNSNRNSPASYSNPGFAVAAGDVISLGISKSIGQSFGSLTGMALDFDFSPDTAVPEPATMGFCAAAIAFALWKRRG